MRLLAGSLLHMSAKFITHRGEKLVGKFRFTAGTESLVECSGQYVRGLRLVDRGLDRPAPFAGIGDAAGKFRESGVVEQGDGREIQQPRGNDAAAAPDFRDIFQVKVVLIVLGVAKRGGFGIDDVILLADIGGANDSEAFGIGSHDAVFDAVVDHLDEVAATIGATMQIPLFRGAADFVATGRARDIADTRSQTGKNRIEVLYDVLFPTDHHAKAPFESPNTTARADIDVMNFFGGELLGAPNVVDIVGITPVNQDVAAFERGQEVMKGLVNDGGRDHQPNRTGLLKFLHEVLERGRTDRLLLGQFVDGFLRPVENHTLMAAFDQSP